MFCKSRRSLITSDQPTDGTRQHVCVFFKSRRSLITSGQPTDRTRQHVCVFCKSRRSLIQVINPPTAHANMYVYSVKVVVL